MSASFSSFGQAARHVKLEEYALQAFVSFVVHLIGLAVLIACYYNLYVLDDYILALFWAVICSIPVFRVKIRVIHAMLGLLDWWWSVEYLVLSASEGGGLRLQALGVWSEDEDSAVLEEVREDLELPPEAMSAQELRRRLAGGEKLHAVVHCRRPPEKDLVLSIVKRGHWLGTFRPYTSIGDLFCRDLPALWQLLALQVSWMFRPIRCFASGEASSQPYFSLLVRFCVLHWTTRFLGARFIMLVLFLATHLYVLVVAVRLLFTLLAALTPYLLQLLSRRLDRVPQEYVAVGKTFFKHWKVAIQWCCWVVRKRSSRVVHAWLATFLENSHFILSILSICVCILVTCKALSLLCLSLRHEAFVIWRTLQGFLQPSPLYQVVMAKVSHLMQLAQEQDPSAAGLWNFGQSVIETTVPEYQEWLHHNVPDFHLVKYVLYDIWSKEEFPGESWLRQNASWASLAGGYAVANDAMGSFGMSSGSSHESEDEEEDDVCSDAIAVGATCFKAVKQVREPPLREQLENTTALLRLVAQGNFSDAIGLVQDAYAEVASASSLLGGGDENRTTITMLGGALHGSTFVARLTMHGTIVFMHVLTMASSMLGQAIVFLTALFYLLASRVSCLEVMGEILMVIDPSQVIFRLSELVVRAVLFSALKMSAFHALFTWLLYSWGSIPVVVVPTVLSALVALVPVVSPVWSVSMWAAVYLWVHENNISAAIAFAANLAVWWQVPTVIYAEIPESNPWLTGLSVVLGIGQFGVAGVVLGPLIASVPLICFNLVKFFNEKRFEAEASHSTSPPIPIATPRRQSTLLTLYQSETFLSKAEETFLNRADAATEETAPPTLWNPPRRRRSSGQRHSEASTASLPRVSLPGVRAASKPSSDVGKLDEASALEASSVECDGELEEAEEVHEEADGCLAPSSSPKSWSSWHHDGWAEPPDAVALARAVGEIDEAEESVDEDTIPLSDLLRQKKHKEIRTRVLRSPGGPLLKKLCSDNPCSSPRGPSPVPENLKVGRKRLFYGQAGTRAAEALDLQLSQQPQELSRHSSLGTSSAHKEAAGGSERGSTAGSSTPTGVAAG